MLPFADLSPTKDQEYLSDGLDEELIADLAKVPGLRVVASSSSFQFSRNEDVQAIGKKLGVTDILEGNVQRQGDRVRIRVELTKADDGTELWTETYDVKVGEIFSVQDNIARAAADALQVKLLGGATGSTGIRATNEDAYEAYLEGEYFLGRGDNEKDLSKAREYADKAATGVNAARNWPRALSLSSQLASDMRREFSGHYQARLSFCNWLRSFWNAGLGTSQSVQSWN